jgi:GMP synthase-like glutamine amidotransferase
MSINALVLQHVPFEGLGSIEAWLAARKATIGCTRFYRSERLPPPEGVGFLIVLGGPMSVNDEAEFPWLRQEKAFVRAAIENGTPVLGICLGAQLIASALGGRVYPNAEREIGWFPVEATPAPADMFRFPAAVHAFHWHGETFDLPPGAVRLARSAGCENQAFQIGRRVIGLQFHLETTAVSAASLIENCRHELTSSRFVQSEAALRAAPDEAYAAANRLMAQVLGYLTEQ